VAFNICAECVTLLEALMEKVGWFLTLHHWCVRVICFEVRSRDHETRCSIAEYALIDICCMVFGGPNSHPVFLGIGVFRQGQRMKCMEA
jgi:hypothetical protein